jgi:hypothetical protein
MEPNRYVQHLMLATEIDKKVAFATVQIGNITIRGIIVWQSPRGKLRVFFPSCSLGYGYEDSVTVPAELRSEIEAEVIAAYRDHKKDSERKASEPQC